MKTVSVTVFLTVTYAVTELKILMLSRLTRENSFSHLDGGGGKKHFAKPL